MTFRSYKNFSIGKFSTFYVENIPLCLLLCNFERFLNLYMIYSENRPEFAAKRREISSF